MHLKSLFENTSADIGRAYRRQAEKDGRRCFARAMVVAGRSSARGQFSQAVFLQILDKKHHSTKD